jgi:hypothetical protein
LGIATLLLLKEFLESFANVDEVSEGDVQGVDTDDVSVARREGLAF